MSTRILSHCVCIVGLLWSMSSAPAYADLGDQLFKLLPDDGAADDQFGVSVAISGTTAIVGAWRDNDNNMLRTYTWIKGAVVVGLIAALTPALTVQWAQPDQQQTLTLVRKLTASNPPPSKLTAEDQKRLRALGYLE